MAAKAIVLSVRHVAAGARPPKVNRGHRDFPRWSGNHNRAGRGEPLPMTAFEKTTSAVYGQFYRSASTEASRRSTILRQPGHYADRRQHYAQTRANILIRRRIARAFAACVLLRVRLLPVRALELPAGRDARIADRPRTMPAHSWARVADPGCRGPRWRPVLTAAPHWATRRNASITMDRLILLSPRVRSTNVIGTSTTVSPA